MKDFCNMKINAHIYMYACYVGKKIQEIYICYLLHVLYICITAICISICVYVLTMYESAKGEDQNILPLK